MTNTKKNIQLKIPKSIPNPNEIPSLSLDIFLLIICLNFYFEKYIKYFFLMITRLLN